jgi:hypothetical protein
MPQRLKALVWFGLRMTFNASCLKNADAAQTLASFVNLAGCFYFRINILSSMAQAKAFEAGEFISSR